MTKYIKMKEEFIGWLDQKRKERKLTRSKLARLSGLSRGTISNVLNGTKYPGWDVCKSIANGMKLPPVLVLTKAGWLDEEFPYGENIEEAAFLLQKIPEEHKLLLIDQIRIVAEKTEKYSTK